MLIYAVTPTPEREEESKLILIEVAPIPIIFCFAVLKEIFVALTILIYPPDV